ncbi:MAG: hypothetical protein M3P51_12775 [Chloroflexota bacterium]|nr:hypothetical protein [Chloroflexota bacterium]
MGADSAHDSGDSCPFYAAPLKPQGTNQCLASAEPVAISARYAASFCTRAQHVQCSLYLVAQWEGRGGPALYSEEEEQPIPEASAQAAPTAVIGSDVDSEAMVHALRREATSVQTESSRRWPLLAALLLLLLGGVAGALWVFSRGDPDGIESNSATTDVNMPVAGASVTPLPPEAPAADVSTMIPTGAPAPFPSPSPTSGEGATGVSDPPAVPTRAVQPTAMPRRANTASPTPTPAPRPTQTSTPRPTPSPTPALASDGIGTTRAEWERDHGRPEDEVGNFLYYENSSYVVAFEEGRIRHVTRTWERRVSLRQAREAARRLLPRDARLLRRGEPRENRVLEVYESKLLRRDLAESSATLHPQADSGIATVVYRVVGDRVESLVMDVGGTTPER